MKNIGIKEAKAKFSQTLEAAEDSPILITHHGKPRSVVMSFEHYKCLAEKPKNLAAVFAKYDWGDVELEPHPKVQARDLNL